MQTDTDLAVFNSLRDRDLRSEGIFVAEGRILVDRLLDHGVPMQSILCSTRFESHYRESIDSARFDSARTVSTRTDSTRFDPPTLLVRDESEIRSTAGYAFHRGVMATGPRPAAHALAEVLEAKRGAARSIAVCSGITNSANLGSIYRSALAFGVSFMVCDDGCGDECSRIGLRSSAGASLLLPSITRIPPEELIETLKAAGFLLVCIEIDKRSIDLDSFAEAIPAPADESPGLAVVFGSEGDGLADVWLSRADHIVSIPVAPGLDSLNVAVTAGIVLHRLRSYPDRA